MMRTEPRRILPHRTGYAFLTLAPFPDERLSPLRLTLRSRLPG